MYIAGHVLLFGVAVVALTAGTGLHKPTYVPSWWVMLISSSEVRGCAV
jgi:hypothetical protein